MGIILLSLLISLALSLSGFPIEKNALKHIEEARQIKAQRLSERGAARGSEYVHYAARERERIRIPIEGTWSCAHINWKINAEIWASNEGQNNDNTQKKKIVESTE